MPDIQGQRLDLTNQVGDAGGIDLGSPVDRRWVPVEGPLLEGSNRSHIAPYPSRALAWTPRGRRCKATRR